MTTDVTAAADTGTQETATQEAAGSPPTGPAAPIRGMWAWSLLRILIGFQFLWAFLDKFFGLGFTTCRASDSSSIDFGCDAAMINGGSPTYGFLTNATEGSHTGFLFDWMASSGPDSIGWADVLFMLALLFGGLALMLGISVRWASIGGIILLLFMYLAEDVWPANNPLVDDHIVSSAALAGVATVGAGSFALQGWFERTFPPLRFLR